MKKPVLLPATEAFSAAFSSQASPGAVLPAFSGLPVIFSQSLLFPAVSNLAPL
ncbi:MAG: hypothetical protein KDC61_01940 [Saprospiraceae bacterium]|nr:hypothetical protein [Saprospiraceae bacterium]MCB9307457.1 hypothetical protein [Lewinellaceae bacterium]